MIVFKEKDYSKKTMAWRVKRAMVPILQGSTGMTKKEAMKTVATTSVKGVKAGGNELGKYVKKNPGAVAGGILCTPIPFPGTTVAGVHAGKAVQRATRDAVKNIRSIMI